MNCGLKKLYSYQTKVYYHEKKHWNLFLARLFCLLASPLTYIFYKGLNLISVYRDARFRSTLNETIEIVQNEKSNIVIFPEISDEGYQKELKGFYAGFIVLCEQLYNQNIDVNVFTAYFKKKKRIYVFGKPIKFSELKSNYPSRKEMCEYLVSECNRLGK